MFLLFYFGRNIFFELFLHDSNTYLFALSNGPFRVVKRSVSHCQMDHFTTSNGMYLKRIDNQLVTHPFRKESYYELYLHKLFIFFHFKLVFPCFPGVDLSMSVRIRRFRNLLPQAPSVLSLAAKIIPSPSRRVHQDSAKIVLVDS